MPITTQSDIRRIQSLLDWKRQVEQPLQRILKKTRPRKSPKIIGGGTTGTVIVQAPAGGIPARSGGTCQSALCKVATITEDGNAATITIDQDAEELDVFNYITIAVLTNGDRYGQAVLQRDGRWWAISDDCHDTE